jgi:hypothetical protein
VARLLVGPPRRCHSTETDTPRLFNPQDKDSSISSFTLWKSARTYSSRSARKSIVLFRHPRQSDCGRDHRWNTRVPGRSSGTT